MSAARKIWFSASELAEAGLPDLPHTRPACSRYIARVHRKEPEKIRQRSGRGGGLEIHVSALPETVQTQLASLPVKIGDSAGYFLKRAKHCNTFTGNNRQTMFRLLLAEIITAYARHCGLSDSAMADLFADTMTKKCVPFFGADYGRHAGYCYGRKACFIENRVFQYIRRNTGFDLARRNRARLTRFFSRYQKELNASNTINARSSLATALLSNRIVKVDDLVCLARNGDITGVPLLKDSYRRMRNQTQISLLVTVQTMTLSEKSPRTVTEVGKENLYIVRITA